MLIPKWHTVFSCYNILIVGYWFETSFNKEKPVSIMILTGLIFFPMILRVTFQVMDLIKMAIDVVI